MQDIISIIVTVLNGEKWIDKCFDSIVKQSAVVGLGVRYDSLIDCNLSIEVCVFDDASTDFTQQLLEKWRENFQKYKIGMKVSTNLTATPKGVGYGRNIAIESSSGSYLCFQDIDDEMLPNRIFHQYTVAKSNHNAIIGSKFIRCPENSTCRFSKWANEIPHEKLEFEIYTSNGPTIIMPTWFCHRNVVEKVGGFSENGSGTPEDLIFFYKHLDNGGKVIRLDEILVIYRYHPAATTFSISKETIWNLRHNRIINCVLIKEPWINGFTIWNAGKQGRRFFRHIPDNLKLNVKAFCDVDKNKIDKCYNYYDETKRRITYSIPIIHFSKANAPILICMKFGLTNGGFERNLMSLNLVENKDYILFS